MLVGPSVDPVCTRGGALDFSRRLRSEPYLYV